MKKRKYEILTSQCKRICHGLRFSTLDKETRTFINREIFYFNHKRCVVIAWAIMALEVLNMVNVLVFSKSKLASQNNRQYFTMYLLLFVSGVLSLVIRRLLRKRPGILAKYYIGFTAFCLGWHAVLSTMDLRKTSNITVFITGIFALSLLIRLKPKETLTMLPGSFLLLLLCARDYITLGTATNGLIVTVVAVLISCSRYCSTLEELGYRKKMVLQEGHRTREQQKLKRMAEQQAALLRHSQGLLFVWDKQTDKLTMGGGLTLSPTDQQTLLEWLSRCSNRNAGTIFLHLKEIGQWKEYSISCTPMLSHNGDLVGAVGHMEPVKESKGTNQEKKDPKRMLFVVK